jgi:hypothetical protein
MTLIVCQVIADKPDQLTFTWSDGTNPFEPYSLNRLQLEDFKKAVRTGRAQLSDLVQLHLDPAPPDQLRQASHALALAGRRLYEAIFAPDVEQLPRAAAVRDWLAALQESSTEADTLEFVVEADTYVPWNLVYDQDPPVPDAFQLPVNDSAAWHPFWGIRYCLASGRRVNPLRRVPVWGRPDVILVIDPEIRASLPDEDRQARRLAAFARASGVRVVESREQLSEALKGDRPYLVYWLSHATPNALVLGDAEIAPAELMRLLRGDPLTTSPAKRGLLFLNACQTGQGGRSGSFLDAVFSAGLSGLIATEEYTINTFANPFGLDFLEAFLNSGECIGQLLHRLRRAGLPLGLLYTAYCPPNLRVEHPAPATPGDAPPATAHPAPEPPAPVATIVPPPRPRPLPEAPYRGLAPYRREHRALFAGREADVQRFAELVNEPGARLLVLHGELGVGKTSFLESGLLPYLEEECVGYRVLCSHQPGEGEEEGPALFIRASRDLVGQVAKALCDFAATPYHYKTPRTPEAPEGRDVDVPLPGILARLTTAGPAATPPDPARLRAAVVADPSLPGRLLAAMGEALPFGLVAIIDQVEEIFTLAQNEADAAGRQTALEMLHRAVETAGDFKIIVAVRTDYYGRLTNALRRGLRDLRGVRDYLLTDLDLAGLTEAIRRPTSAEPVRYSSQIPFNSYGFTYEDQLPERIARDTLALSRTAHDSALLLVQVVCSRLHGEAVRQGKKSITTADLERLGGVRGGTRAHAEVLLDRLVKQLAVRPEQGPPPPPAGQPWLARLFARAAPVLSEKIAFKRLFRRLYARLPDGRVTSALVPADDLARRWRGQARFDDVVREATGEDYRLLRETRLLDEGKGDKRYVGLGHDALAPVAAAWDDEVLAGTRFRRAMGLGFSLALAALLLIGGLSLAFLRMAGQSAGKELVASSQQSSELTAEFAADKLTWTTRRYWRILATEAEGKELRQWLRDAGSPGARTELQRWAEGRARVHADKIDGLQAWAVLDARGIQVANSKDPQLVGRDFSWRDYFHGMGRNDADDQGKMGPLRRAHLSTRFSAVTDKTFRVACSIPVWDGEAGGQVLGVLTITLAPKQFLVLPEGIKDDQRLILFLDRTGQVADQCGCIGEVGQLAEKTLDELNQHLPVVRGLGGREGDGPWIAARTPVKFERAGEQDPGWSVVVAEREADVLTPLANLRTWVLLIGAGGLLLVSVALAGLIPLIARRLQPGYRSGGWLFGKNNTGDHS